MGYIHNVSMSQFLPPSLFLFTAGTWAPSAEAGNLWSYLRAAADASFWVYIPILIPSNSVANKGAYLESVEVMYEIETAGLDDFANVEIWNDAFSVDGTVNVPASVAVTVDTAHDTAAERKAVDEHRMVITLDTAAWIDNEEGYHVDLLMDAAAASVVRFYGALVNYTLRL